MPVQPTYPGVYIEEIPSGVHTITGVSTSIAAFLGRTSKGPINKAVRILSLSDYSRQLGEPHPKSDLANSVTQFFMNGGTDCYVVRLAAGATKADVTLTDIDGNAGNNHVLTAVAKTEGSWGNGIRLEVDYNTLTPNETFNFTVIQLEGGVEVIRETHAALSMDPESSRFAPSLVSQSSNLIDLKLHANVDVGGAKELKDIVNSFAGFSQSRPFLTTPVADFRTEFEGILTSTPKFEINVDEEGPVSINLSDVLGPAAPQILPGSTWTLADMATRLKEVINLQLDDAVSGLRVDCSWQTSGNVSVLHIITDSGNEKSVRIRRSSSDDFAVPMMLGIDQGGIEVVRYSNFRPVPTAAFFHDVNKIVEMAGLTRDALTSITIDGGSAVNFDFSSLTPLAADPWFLDQTGNADGLREKLRIMADSVNNDISVPWRAEVWGYHLAIIAEEGSINKTASGVVSAVNTFFGGTNFTRNVRQYALSDTGTGGFQQLAPPGSIGINGSAPTEAEYIGNEADQTGFHALDPVDLFNLMVIPGDEEVTEATLMGFLGAVSAYCEYKRAFLLIDAPASWTNNDRPEVVTNTALINDVRVLLSKKNSAVFYPRLQYNDLGLMKTIGPSGAIAGLMARTDTNRGVWKAPAGTEANLRGFLDVKVNLTDPENGVLNKEGVNCIRKFPTGIVNWGARTMAGSDLEGSEWKYIPIRRLALFIEESLFRGTKWVVFEPNDEPLWSKIRLNVGAFMNRLFRQGAFQGDTPNKAYFVKCDAETTTQSDRDLGIVNILVGFAPLKPAEFVIIKIQQIAGDLTT